jgi:N-acetylneuraminic acid mutarotase
MKADRAIYNLKLSLTWILAGLMLTTFWYMASIGLAAEDTWTRKADMPTARADLATCVVDGKIYAIGGGAGPFLTTVEVYDPATNTWSTGTDMPAGRGALAASVVNGKIYTFGGKGGSGTVYEYDPETDTWTQKADMTTKRVSFSTSVVDGKIYAIGGAPSWDTLTAKVDEYDPATDTWTEKAAMSAERTGLSASVVNGKIYAIGGWRPGDQPDGIQLSIVEEYDPATDTWTAKTDMPTARTSLTTCAVNGKIYAIGGGGEGVTVFGTVEEYDPTADRWTTKAGMPTPRLYHSASVANGKIYAIGGLDANGAFPNVEEYTPEGWPFDVSVVSPQDKLSTTWGGIKSDWQCR